MDATTEIPADTWILCLRISFSQMSLYKAFLRQSIVLNAVLVFFLKKWLERECELINAYWKIPEACSGS